MLQTSRLLEIEIMSCEVLVAFSEGMRHQALYSEACRVPFEKQFPNWATEAIPPIGNNKIEY